MNYSMLNPVLFGEGVIAETGKQAKSLGITKAIMVSDSFLSKTEGYQKCVESIRAEGIELVEFNNCPADPPDTTIDEGGRLARSEQVNGVIAMGGGSVLDTGKAISILLTNPPPFSQYFGCFMKNPEAPLIAIPSNAGTGSESTMACVITNSATNQKLSAYASARLSIVDPELTYSAPPALTANSALDALAHGCEALTQLEDFASPFSDVMAVAAIERVIHYLPIALKDGRNVEARRNLCLASNFGGIAIQNGTTQLGHCVAHTLGSAFHLPHGQVCGLGLPVFVRYTATYAPEKTKKICELFGVNAQTNDIGQIGENAFAAVRDFVRSCGIKSLAEMGITEDQVTALAETVTKDPTWFVVPRKLELDELRQMLADLYHTF